jgi:hypothetical protein
VKFGGECGHQQFQRVEQFAAAGLAELPAKFVEDHNESQKPHPVA